MMYSEKKKKKTTCISLIYLPKMWFYSLWYSIIW